MPVYKRKGPLPDGHPAKGTSIIFGIKPPPGWKDKLRKQRKDGTGDEASKSRGGPDGQDREGQS